MWRPRFLAILMLMIAAILPLPLRAQHNVAPIPHAGSASCSGGVPTAERRSLPASGQAPTAAPGQNVALIPHGGSAFCSGGVPTAERRSETAATTASTPGKSFTQEQISNMVRAGLGDGSGAKLIEQRGIDFAPAEDSLESLKAAGASEAFLKALRAAVALIPHAGPALVKGCVSGVQHCSHEPRRS